MHGNKTGVGAIVFDSIYNKACTLSFGSPPQKKTLLVATLTTFLQ